MERVDQDLVGKILESLSLNYKAVSLLKEINMLDAQIQVITAERVKMEADKKAYMAARDGAGRYVQMVSQMVEDLNKKISEINKNAEKVLEAQREVARLVSITQKPHSFDEKIVEANNILIQANQFKKDMVKDLNEIRTLKDELKKQGIDINLDKKVPTNISM